MNCIYIVNAYMTGCEFVVKFMGKYICIAFVCGTIWSKNDQLNWKWVEHKSFPIGFGWRCMCVTFWLKCFGALKGFMSFQLWNILLFCSVWCVHGWQSELPVFCFVPLVATNVQPNVGYYIIMLLSLFVT